MVKRPIAKRGDRVGDGPVERDGMAVVVLVLIRDFPVEPGGDRNA